MKGKGYATYMTLGLILFLAAGWAFLGVLERIVNLFFRLGATHG